MSLRQPAAALTLVLYFILQSFGSAIQAPPVPATPSDTRSQAAPAAGGPSTTLMKLLASLHQVGATLPEDPLESRTLGVQAVPSEIARLYAAKAETLERPLADAVRGWAAYLNVPEDAGHLHEFLARGDAWPRPVQERIALLVWAITDASSLQATAIQGLAPDEVARLVRHLPDVARSPSAQLDSLSLDTLRLAERINSQPILDAAAVLVAALDAAMPILAPWADSVQQDHALRGHLREQFQAWSTLKTKGPTNPEDGLSRASTALSLAAQFMEIEQLPWARDAHDLDLSRGIQALARASSNPIPDGVDEELLGQIWRLPPELQGAIGAIVDAHVDLALATGESMAQQYARSIDLLETIRTVSPILRKWSLLYSHFGAPLPKTTEPDLQSLETLVRFASRPGADPAEALRLAVWLGSSAEVPAQPRLTKDADLVQEVLRLYERYSLPVSSETVGRLERAAELLPSEMASASSLLLRALNDAEETIDAAILYAATTHQAFLSGEGPRLALHALINAVPTPQQVDALGTWLRINDELQATMTIQAAVVTQAVLAAKRLLAESPGLSLETAEATFEPSPLVRLQRAIVGGVDWYFRHLTPLGLLPTASAQTPSPGCPTASPLAACESDIWFQDPLLHWIVIGGPGTTIYDPLLLRGGATLATPAGTLTLDRRGQMLTLDLGGDDIYRNNAGGVVLGNVALPGQFGLLPGQPGNTGPNDRIMGFDSFRVALALDLGGDDDYQAPPRPHPAIGIQGAGVGGLGILWDRAGDDTYFATREAQGYGHGRSLNVSYCPLSLSSVQPHCTIGVPIPGIGILHDEQGQDKYEADEVAQGVGVGLGVYAEAVQQVLAAALTFGITALSDSPTVVANGPGIGILFDLEGDDEYRVARDGGFAVAAANQGIGLLIEGGGNDTYLGGLQGNVPPSTQTLEQGAECLVLPACQAVQCTWMNGAFGSAPTEHSEPPCLIPGVFTIGLALLADAGGDDKYSRTRPPSESLMDDGDCWTSLSTPRDEPLQDVQPASPLRIPSFAQETYTIGRSQLGIFVDLQHATPGCRYDPTPAAPPIAGIAPTFNPPDAARLTTDDLDADHWPSGIEYLLGTNPSDGADHPSGWPPRPANWPSEAPYPPEGGTVLPGGPHPLLVVPNVVVLGDVTDDTYARGRDFPLSIDLGGNDFYQNQVGGGSSLFDLIPVLAIDVGDGDDRYEAPSDSLGANGILIDEGGDDAYHSAGPSMGYAHPDDPKRLALGFLIDLGGNDTYESQVMSQGVVEATDAPSSLVAQHVAIGLLLDLQGDDHYTSPTQGYATGTARMPTQGIGVFLDLAGNDTYAPTGSQGRTEHRLTGLDSAPLTQTLLGVFLDADGWDRYEVPDGRGGLLEAAPAYNNHLRLGLQHGDSARDFPVAGFVASPLTYASLRLDENATNGNTFQSNCRKGSTDSADPSACVQDDPAIIRLPLLGIAIDDQAAPNEYRDDYVLLIDSGGDDYYANNAGATIFRSLRRPMVRGDSPDCAPAEVFEPIYVFGQPLCESNRPLTAEAEGEARLSPLAALNLDLGGNDQYDATEHLSLARVAPMPHSGPVSQEVDQAALLGGPRRGVLAQGAGFLGAGLLLDAQGDDSYKARSIAQGSGLWGFGLLWDRDGIDEYSMDPEVLGPAAAGTGLLFQEALLHDRWQILSPFLPEPLDLPGESRRPDVGGTLLVFQNDQAGDWDVYRNAIPQPVPVAQGPGHQVAPRTDGRSIVWQDNLGPDPRVWIRTLDTAARQLSPAPFGWSQLRPDVSAPVAVWQELRGATWDIRGKDLLRNADLTIADDARLDETFPQIHYPYVSWRSTPMVGEPGPTQFEALHLETGKRTTLSIGDALQGAPVLGPGWAMFTEERDTGDAIRLVDLLTGEDVIVAATAEAPCRLETPHRIRHLSVDQAHPGLAVFTALPTDSPNVERQLVRTYSLVFRDANGRGTARDASCFVTLDPNQDFGTSGTPAQASLGQDVPPSDIGSRAGAALSYLQGSVAQLGRGILLEEGGADSYRGYGYAQGAGRSFAGGRDPDQAAVGLLAELGGNDDYASNRFSQGSHDMVTGYDPLRPEGQDLEWQSTAATLYDLQGRDAYRAAAFSQGWSGLTLGEHAINIIPGVQPSAAPVFNTYAGISAGTLIDLGNEDLYEYAGESGILGRLSTTDEATATFDLRTRIANQDFRGDTHCDQPLPAEVCAILDPLRGDAAANVDCQENAPETACPGLALVTRSTRGRNNLVWTQRGRPFTPTGPPELDPAASSCLSGGLGCPPVATIGGLGVDRDATAPILAHLQSVIPQAFDVEIVSPTQTPRGTLEQFAILEARVTQRQGSTTPFVPKGVDFFVRALGADQAIRLGPARPMPEAGCRFCIQWPTHLGAFPDASYLVQAIVILGLPDAGISFGTMEANRVFAVDNPPSIRVTQVQGRSFSPHPSNPNQPNSFTVSFIVSTDLGATPTALEARIYSPKGSPILTKTLSPAATPGPISASWAGRLGASLAPDGPYRFQILARDAGGHETRAEESLLLDATSPGFTCIRIPGRAECNPGTIELPAGVNTVNAATESSPTGIDLILPLGFESPTIDASGVKVYHLYARIRTEGASGPWILIQDASRPAADIRLAHGTRLELVALAEDGVGNLECAYVCEASRSPPLNAFPGTVESKRRGVFSDSGAHQPGSSILLGDAAPPSLVEANINGVPFADAGALQFGPASSVTITASASEIDSLPVRFPLTLISLENPTQFTKRFVIEAQATEAPHQFVAIWSDWPKETADWPEGPFVAQLLAQDAAGNPSALASLTLALDRTPPDIDPSSIRIDYPEGRLHAVPGDTVSLRVFVSDPPVGNAVLGLDALEAHVDASRAVTGPVTVTGPCAAENVPATRVPLCFDGFQYYRTSFRVDAPNIPGEARTIPLPLEVGDGLGNRRALPDGVFLVLGEPNLGIHDVRLQANADTIAVSWNTTRPATGLARLAHAVGDFDDGSPSISTPDGLRHQALLTGLRPQTRYRILVNARDPGTGLVESYGSLATETSGGLASVFLYPGPGAAVHGEIAVRWRTSVAPGLSGLVRYALELAPATDESPARPLNEFEGPPGEHEFVLLGSSLPNGDYRLRVRTTFRGDLRVDESPLFHVDNTSPRTLPVSPLEGSTVSPEGLVLEVFASDTGTGVDCSTVKAFLNEAPLPILRCDQDGVAADPASSVQEGANEFRVLVADRAGNARTLVVGFMVDSDGPRFVDAWAHYPAGQTKAKDVDLILVEAHIEGDADIQAVWLDARPWGSSEPVGFVEETPDQWLGATRIIHASHEGTLNVTLRATDHLGHTSATRVPVQIDNTPPRAQPSRPILLPSGENALFIQANEPVSATALVTDETGAGGRISMDASELVQSLGEAVDQGFRAAPLGGSFAGLLVIPGKFPKDQQRFTVILRDAAGHETAETTEIKPSYLQDPLLPPTGLAIRLGDANEPILQWRPPNGGPVQGYHVYRASSESAPFEHVAVVQEPSWTDPIPLTPNMRIYFVTSTTQGAESLPSETIRLDAGLGPLIEDASVQPAEGSTETRFRFAFTFIDAPAKPARTAWLILDDVPYRMASENLEACQQGCRFQLDTTLPATSLDRPIPAYHFEAETSRATVRFPVVGELDGPFVVEAAFIQAQDATQVPGWAGYTTLGALAVALFRRRIR